MTWNSLRLPAITLVTGAMVLFTLSHTTALAQTVSSTAQILPNTGQQLTPLAPIGARFTALNPGLSDYPAWTAGQAVTSITSPDYKTLLVLTSGYNLVRYSSGPNAGSTNQADSHEYVFVYDISRAIPVQKQVIQIANTYNGIAFDPGGQRFYVTGGVNDNVHIFTLQSGVWIEQPGSPVALGHSSGVGAGVPAAAAGIAVTQNGLVLVVTNYYNDSISILTLSNGAWRKTAELDLRPGVINPAQSGVPGGEFPLWVTVKGNSTAYVSSLRDREIDVVNISTPSTPTLVTRIKVKGQPLKMTLNSALTTLYAAEEQTDSVAVIDTNSNTLLEEVPASAPAGLLPPSRAGLFGNNTNSVTLSPDQSTLYVTNGNTNNVAVLSVAALPGLNAVVGLIPTGWYPNSVSFNASGDRMYVVNGKSPTGPNPGYCYGGVVPGLTATGCAASNEYNLQLIKAGLQDFPTPGSAQLTLLTQRVAMNNGYRSTEDSDTKATMQFLQQHIQHVIYIIKENKTYDQILGDLGTGDGNPALTEFGAAVTPNEHNLARNFVNLDHFYDSSEVSYDGWAWSTSARATDIVARQTPVNYAGRGVSYESEGTNRNINTSYADLATRILSNPSTPNDPNILPGTTNEAAPDGPGNQLNTGYLWDQAIRAGLSVRDYGFFFQNVGPAIINANPPAQIVGYSTNTTLHPFTDPYFRGFDMNIPDFYLYQEWLREFNTNYVNGGLPALTLLRLPHDHTGSFGSALAGVNTPILQVADNDYAVGLVVQTIANSIYKGNTLVFVIQDDSQNGGDHVESHRSIAFIAGPYVKQQALVSTSYNTVNFVRTIEEILKLAPLNLNDSTAQPMADAFDTNQATWTYKATPSTYLCSTALPISCSSAGLKIPKEKHSAAYWAKVTKGLDFSKEDRVDEDLYNRILWKGIMGNKPYPYPATPKSAGCGYFRTTANQRKFKHLS
jgi:DNA-binding beta-propeller fold protein YncE